MRTILAMAAMLATMFPAAQATEGSTVISLGAPFFSTDVRRCSASLCAPPNSGLANGVKKWSGLAKLEPVLLGSQALAGDGQVHLDGLRPRLFRPAL
jgi:hypothetical protein